MSVGTIILQVLLLQGFLLGTSAVLGGFATYFAIIGAAMTTPVIFVIVALIAIGFAIAYFKHNQIQDWLNQGHWGKHSQNWDFAKEMKEYQLALEEMKPE